jgi:hypothetical protein
MHISKCANEFVRTAHGSCESRVAQSLSPRAVVVVSAQTSAYQFWTICTASAHVAQFMTIFLHWATTLCAPVTRHFFQRQLKIMTTPIKQKVCLIVIDGWGISEEKEGNRLIFHCII